MTWWVLLAIAVVLVLLVLELLAQRRAVRALELRVIGIEGARQRREAERVEQERQRAEHHALAALTRGAQGVGMFVLALAFMFGPVMVASWLAGGDPAL